MNVRVGSHAAGRFGEGAPGDGRRGKEMHLKITSFTVTPWALVGQTKG